MTDFEKQAKQQPQVALSIPEQRVLNLKRVSTEEKLPYPDVAPVFLCLKQTTRPRKWCLQITYSPWFDLFSTLMVLLSCVTLGMYKPCEEKNRNLKIMEKVLFAFFMFEMLIKIVALGIYGYEGSYLKNNWNKFDCFINTGEVLDSCMSYFNIHLHVFQVLRPVRLICRVQSLRVLVAILLETAPMFANVLVLYVFVIHIFAVVGVQLWAGALRNRCFLGEDINAKYNLSLSPYYVSKYGDKFPFICSPPNKNGMLRCDEVPPLNTTGCSVAAPRHAFASNLFASSLAGVDDRYCVNWNSFYNVCRASEDNPYKGAINFDNIGYAWITIFQVVTLEGWTEIMFFVMDAHSSWNFIFFIFITIMGSFIMINVCAVVIATQFSENMEREVEDKGDGVVSFSWLCGKITGILVRISGRNNRVNPKVSDSKATSALIQVWTPLNKKLRRIVKSHLFDQVIMFAVFLSILAMVMEHHKQPKELTYMLHICNIILTVVFVLEMTIKLLALSWAYFRDLNNVFDFGIVVISVWELIAKAGGRLSVLRAFRMLRFLRLVHFLPYLKRQLMVLKRTMIEAAALCKLLLFVIFLFSILGMILFCDKFNFKTVHGDIRTDRKNFDSLLWSMVTVFEILTHEDWNLVLHNAMAVTSPWAFLYFVALIVIGKHVLLNVLVGIVVLSFQARQSPGSDQVAAVGSANFTSPILTPSETDPINPAPEEDFAPTDTNEENKCLNMIQKVLHWCKEHEDWSLYMLSPQNRFRICCQRLVSHKMFDHGILFFILLSCCTIAMERPGINPQSTERRILIMSRYVFSAVFFVEMLFKVLALGLLIGKDNYCSSSWNIVDGLLVILSLVHVMVSLVSTGKNDTLGMLKVLRLLRTLRPLRVIKRAPKLKLAVEALLASVKPIGNIVIISCIFFFLYGILGVQLFKGKFFYCVGPDTRNITSKADCLSANYRWIRKPYNFDNLPQALMSVFVMYSSDGWVSLMYDGLDAVGVDKQPVRNHNQWILIFFISFVVVSFLLLDMFIGVMVETFHQCQQEQKRGDKVKNRLPEGEVLKEQCIEPEPIPYYTHYPPWRRSIHTLCTSNFLDLFMTVVIVASVLMMAFEHYQQPQYIQKLTEYSYYVFTAILILEVILKFVAFGVLRFMKISWNQLDVLVVLVSIISIIFSEMEMSDAIPINPSILRVCRVLRLAQVLKAKKIRVLLKTIIRTLSQKGDIIYIIEKPPVGTWTGKLNNKMGSFKFIYVNLLPDESPPVRRRHTNSKTRRSKTKPKTLEEVLDVMGLTELSSLLSMHGFQSLEDFAGLKESHLNELNITDSEQRSKILNASEMLRDSDEESEPEDRSREAAKDPRDSGCFESSENLESGREEPKAEEEPQGETSEKQTNQEEEEDDEQQQEEIQSEQLEAMQEQLGELTVDEGS